MFSLHLIMIWCIMMIILIRAGLSSQFMRIIIKLHAIIYYSGWLNSCLFFILHLKSLHLTRHKSWGCRTSVICIHDIIWHWNVSGLMTVFPQTVCLRAQEDECYFWVLIPYYIIWFLIIWEAQSLSHCNWSITTWRI